MLAAKEKAKVAAINRALPIIINFLALAFLYREEIIKEPTSAPTPVEESKNPKV